MFKPRESTLPGPHILYDAAHFTKADVTGVNQRWFDPAYWQDRGCVTGWAGGRGRVVFFRTGGVDYVLRHYRRGGRVATLLGDRYLWTGLSQSRAWREWGLLRRLTEMDLPVPRPVAAQVDQSGIFYRADIITLRIPQARSLAQHLLERALPDEWWQRVGRTLSRFHARGVDHADLNAHNILLNPDGVFLIDFDRGRLRRPDRAAARANLARLQRSLEKLGRLNEPFHCSGPAWQALLRGYDQA